MSKRTGRARSSRSAHRRSSIGRRIRAGLAQARSMGVRLGRPPVIDVEWKQIDGLRNQGFTIREIAKRIGVAKSTLADFLARHHLSR